MAGDVFLRDGVPPAMGERDAGVFAHGLEGDLDRGDLVRREGGLAPGEGEALTALPGGDAADLEHLAAGERGDEAGLTLEAQRAIAARGELEEGGGAPPGADLAGENVEGFLRAGRHAQGDDDRAHGFFRAFALPSTCALKAES